MCKLVSKMYQNTFGGRAPPEPAGELNRSPGLHICYRGGPTFKWREREETGRRKEGEGRGNEG